LMERAGSCGLPVDAPFVCVVAAPDVLVPLAMCSISSSRAFLNGEGGCLAAGSTHVCRAVLLRNGRGLWTHFTQTLLCPGYTVTLVTTSDVVPSFVGGPCTA